jgi:hypothetical protein
MAILAIASMHKNADKIEHILHERLRRITEIVDMVGADINRGWKLEMVIYLSSAEVVQIKLESLEMKN